METNENAFNFGGATEVVQPAAAQEDFSNADKIDAPEKVTPEHQSDLNISVEEGLKKPIDNSMDMPIIDSSIKQNNTDHTVNSSETIPTSNITASPVKEAMSPVKETTSPVKEAASPVKEATSPVKEAASPVKETVSPVKENDVLHSKMQDENEEVNEVSKSQEAQVTTNSDDHTSQDVEMMEEDESNTVEEPVEPDSTPVEDGVMNDAHHSEDETKVEEVIGDSGHSEVKESTTEPVVEEPTDAPSDEPTDVDMKDDVKDSADTKVEISDVTDKEDDTDMKTDEEILLEHINTAYRCLDDYKKTRDEVKIKDCMSLLTEIKCLAERTVDTLTAFKAVSKVDKGHSSSKKGKGRGKAIIKQSKSMPKAYKNDIGGESDFDPLEVNLKEIKGLAVFAKWPSSGWFYPGVVRDLALADWKTNQNITVTFYDGLERDMKSINIFPAELIPTASVLFDLDDETDMTVAGVERDGNWVQYVLNCSGQPDITKDFDKMAIKGAHMKTIKQAVESATPDNSNKSETLLSGRRARGKSSVFNEDYVSTSSPRSTEKRKSKVEDSKSAPAKTPAKRKSSTKEDEVGDSTPSRSASKRRQVNGTKSTPRRAAKK